MEIFGSAPLTTHHLLVSFLLFGLLATVIFTVRKKYVEKVQFDDDKAMELIHATFDLIFAISLIVTALLKPELLVKTGELLVPMVLGGVSLAVRAYFKIKRMK